MNAVAASLASVFARLVAEKPAWGLVQ